MLSKRRTADSVDVPSHVEEEFQVVGCHFRIVDIGNPKPSGIVVIRLTHLIVDKSGLCSREPEIIVRTPPIREMIIHSRTSAALLLAGIRETGDIPIVVIAPHQGDIVRHLEALLIQLQHLFIRHKHLHLLFGCSDVLHYELLLVVDNLLQGLELLLFSGIALHRTVVNTTHANSKYVITGCLYFFKALNPILLYCLAIGAIVEASSFGYIPLAYIVAQKRFTVRGSYDDAARVSNSLVAWCKEECLCTLVHSRPDGIGTQAQQQLEYLAISAGTYLPIGVWLECIAAPRTDTPVFIVDKDTPIGYTRALLCGKVSAKHQPVTTLRHYIAPPYPRRDTSHARELQQSICHSPAISTLYEDASILCVYAESVSRKSL